MRMPRPSKRVISIWAASWLLAGCVSSGDTARGETMAVRPPGAPNGLLVELLTSPQLGIITDPWPEFGWAVPSSYGPTRQTAFQIQVSRDVWALGAGEPDLWDSGKVTSDQSLNVTFGGSPLADDSTYYWHVRIWDEAGETSPYSVIQPFHTGTLGEDHVAARHKLQVREVMPSSLKRRGDGSYFVDFGKAAFGTVQLDLPGLPEDAVLDLHFGEKLDGPGVISRKPGGTVRYRNVKLAVEAGGGTYTAAIPADKRNTGRHAIPIPEHIGEVLPFRYLEIKGCPVDIQAGTIRMLAAEYPFNEGASRFQSSSDELDAVFDFCKYSIRATTFAGVYVDGDRERIPYEADAYINQLSHYGVDREYSLARYSHEYLLTHATWPTEWLLHSVLMAGADYQFTGDIESAARWYETLEHKTLSALRGDDGLIQTKEVDPDVLEGLLRDTHSPRLEDIVDWPRGERDDYVFTPVNTVVNAFHYRALVVMSELAAALGKTADAADFQDRATRTRHAFNAKLFDESRGVYVDGVGTDHSSLHANMMPLAFGMVPEEHVASVTAFVKAKGMACSVYGAQYLLEALYRAGEAEAALGLMTAEHDRSWLHMLNAVGTTITLEAWDPKYKPNLDWNHAWGAAPANIIPHYLVGVRPLEPGFKKILIKPQLGGLESVSATVPTVRGPVSVRIEAAATFTADVTTPGNTTAEIHLPWDRRYGELIVDGKTVEPALLGDFVVIDGLAPGRHIVVMK